VTRTQGRQILQWTRAPSSEKRRQLKEVRSEGRRRKKRSGGIRPAAGKHSKHLKNEKYLEKLKSSARQGAFISDNMIDYHHPTGAMDGNSGGSKVSEGMNNKDNCGAAGTK
jgi:hypothetical protein